MALVRLGQSSSPSQVSFGVYPAHELPNWFGSAGLLQHPVTNWIRLQTPWSAEMQSSKLAANSTPVWMNSLPGAPAPAMIAVRSESLSFASAMPLGDFWKKKTRFCTMLEVPLPGRLDWSCGYSRRICTPERADGVVRLTTTSRFPMGGLVQVLPSLSHVALQPSPEVRLPSSHCSPSLAQKVSSPHVSSLHPVQPSHGFALPSSHCSVGLLMLPSPHVPAIVVEVVELVLVVLVVGGAGQVPPTSCAPHFVDAVVFGFAGVTKSRQ